MEPAEFARLVLRMRVAQKRYFRTRSAAALDEAKHLEALVDDALTTVPAEPAPQQATLFD